MTEIIVNIVYAISILLFSGGIYVRYRDIQALVHEIKFLQHEYEPEIEDGLTKTVDDLVIDARKKIQFHINYIYSNLGVLSLLTILWLLYS